MKATFFYTLFVLMLAVTGKAFASGKMSSEIKNCFSDSSIQIISHGVRKDLIRLFPNPTSNGAITINSNTNEPLHFYIFDLDGVLISRVELMAKQQKKISDLKKGSYTYDVFKQDESIEQGKIIVK